MSDKDYVICGIGLVVFFTLWILLSGTFLGLIASGGAGICLGLLIAAGYHDLFGKKR